MSILLTVWLVLLPPFVLGGLEDRISNMKPPKTLI